MPNETYFEVFSQAESVCFIIYFLLIISLGSIGNIFVIYASRSYSSLNLDRVTIMFVQHLAVADLIKILFMTTPMLVNHFYYLTHPDEFEWYSSYALCKVLYFMLGFSNGAVGWFILAVSLHRLARCLAPTKLQQSGKKYAKILIGVCWIFGLFLGGVLLFLPAKYKMTSTLCVLDTREKLSPTLALLAEYTNYPTLSFIFLSVVLSNAISLIYTCVLTRDQPNTNFRQANLTVLAISVGLVVCYIWLPFQMVNVYYLMATGREGFPSRYLKYTVAATAASSLINPVIYTSVNKGFKRFASKVVRKNWGKLTGRRSLNQVSTGESRVSQVGQPGPIQSVEYG